MLRTFASDVSFAVRILLKRPGFSIVAVLVLAIGIGANTAMFAALDAVLLSSLPYPESERLVMGRATFDGGLNPMASAYDYFDYRDRSDVFESLAAITSFAQRATITGGELPESIESCYVSWDLFATLDVAPTAGRHFFAEEGTAEGSGVGMISFGYWQRRFGGDPEVVGSVFMVNGRPVTVVGVMPAGFRFLNDAEIWRPMYLDGPYAGARRWHNWLIVGRLKQGETLRQAQSQMDVISAQLAQEYPETNEIKALQLDPLHAVLVEGQRPSLLLLMAAVGLVLLIACGNVAGLLLARGSTRTTEMAIRASIGAARGRLVAQLLTEGLVLAVAGGIAGVALAAGLVRLIPAMVGLGELGITRLTLEPTLLLFALFLSVITGLLFGAVPAFRNTAIDLSAGLRGGARAGRSEGGARLRSVLVVSQVALSVLLMIGAGLLLRSFTGLLGTDVGFDSDRLLTAEVALPGAEYADGDRGRVFFESLLAEVGAIPGVTDVGMVSQLPLRDSGNNIYVRPADGPAVEEDDSNVAFTRVVMPGYFGAMRIPLLSGRVIEEADDRSREPVLVINRTMADRLWRSEEPVGRQVIVDMGEEVTFTVVGVVGDARLSWVGEEPRMAMYHSFGQIGRLTMRLAIRTAVEPASVAASLRGIVQRMDPRIPVRDLVSMREIIKISVSSQQVIAGTLSSFSLVAVLLAAVGLYGVLAFYVNRRAREIGIRMALGATGGQVMALIMRRGLLLVFTGLAVGLMAAAASGSLIRSMLHGVGTTDLLTYAGMSLLFVAVAIVACAIPAFRAVRVDPVRALQAD